MPLNDFCSFTPTHGHTPERPVLALFVRHRSRQRRRTSPRSGLALTRDDLPLSKKDRGWETSHQTALLDIDEHGVARPATSSDPEKPLSEQDIACGDASLRPPLATSGRLAKALSCVGHAVLSKGTY